MAVAARYVGSRPLSGVEPYFIAADYSNILIILIITRYLFGLRYFIVGTFSAGTATVLKAHREIPISSPPAV